MTHAQALTIAWLHALGYRGTCDQRHHSAHIEVTMPCKLRPGTFSLVVRRDGAYMPARHYTPNIHPRKGPQWHTWK